MYFLLFQFAAKIFRISASLVSSHVSALSLLFFVQIQFISSGQSVPASLRLCVFVAFLQ